MKNDDHAGFTEQDALSFFTRYLDEMKWMYHQHQDQPILYCGFNGQDALWDFSMIARNRGDDLFHLSVNSFIPNKAPLARRAAVAEIISRINWELVQGCFEMNHADGEIRFRTTVALAGGDITPSIIRHLVQSNLCIVDDHLSQILAVLHSHKSPESVMKPKPAKPSKPKACPKPRFELN